MGFQREYCLVYEVNSKEERKEQVYISKEQDWFTEFEKLKIRARKDKCKLYQLVEGELKEVDVRPDRERFTHSLGEAFACEDAENRCVDKSRRSHKLIGPFHLRDTPLHIEYKRLWECK